MILITGHKGFVGKNLIKNFIAKKIQYQSYNKNNNYFGKKKINFIFHLAFRKKSSSVKKLLKSNIDFTKNIIKIAKYHNAVLIFPSTIAYYPSKIAHKENDKMFSYNLYSFSKLLCEKIILNNISKHLILRISNVYGEHGNSFVDKIKKIKNGKKKVLLNENDWIIRDFIKIDYLIYLFEKILTSRLPQGIYNVGCGISIKLSRVIKLAGLKKKIYFSNTAKFTPHRPIIKLNIDKLNKFIKFKSNNKKLIRYICE